MLRHYYAVLRGALCLCADVFLTPLIFSYLSATCRRKYWMCAPTPPPQSRYSTAQTRFRRELAEEAHRLEELHKLAAVRAEGAGPEDEGDEGESGEKSGAVDAAPALGPARSQQSKLAQNLAGHTLSAASCARTGSNIGGKLRGAEIGASAGTGAGSSSRRSRSGQGPRSSGTALVFALPESSMRADFRCIVDDLQARAAYFARTAPLPNPAVKIVGSAGTLHLCVGATVFVAGDLVTAFSVLSQETFSGVITSVAADDISVRCGSGLRIAVALRQLLEGRVVLSHDHEGSHLLGVLQAHAAMVRGASPGAATLSECA
jgi:hypothetical protein